jgi:hypothetical protein
MDKLMIIIDRLKEPSTWSGIAAVAVAFGLLSEVDAAQLAEHVPVVLAGVAGIIAMCFKEKK